MKNIFIFLIFVPFIQSCKKTNSSSQNKFEIIEIALITNLCNDLSEWTERKRCSNEEILKKIRAELDYNVINKLTEKKYSISYTFTFNLKGRLTETRVKTDNHILNTEFQRIIDKIDIDIYLKDENGNLKSGQFDLPIDLNTLK